MSSPPDPIRVLLEMRPALDGHAGIPQETRLLFRGLAGLGRVQVQGLLQSANLVVEPGIPVLRGERVTGLSPERQLDLLSKVVVSLQQGAASHRLEHWRRRWLRWTAPVAAAAASMLGLRVRLTFFDASAFRDFAWRSMFARTLPAEDMELVTAQQFRVLRWPWSAVNAVGVVTGTLGHAVYPRLDTRGTDIFIAETPYPGRVAPGTTMIVRYHDAIPLLMPHTVKNRGYHRAQHLHALRRNARDGAWFACVSEATRRDLLSVLPELESRAVTIPNMISPWFCAETEGPARVPEVIWSRKNRSAPHHGGAAVRDADLQDGALPYLLAVSTIEPRKNHLTLIDAWEYLRSHGHPKLNLVFVGSLGWNHDDIMRRCEPWLQRGGLHLLENVPAGDLRLLYRHAAATVCPSFGEGFDFAGIEAMLCGGLVIASDIPVHREIYQDAALYCSAYSADDLVRATTRLLERDAGALRQTLREAGQRVSQDYAPRRVLPAWADLLDRVVASRRRNG